MSTADSSLQRTSTRTPSKTHQSEMKTRLASNNTADWSCALPPNWKEQFNLWKMLASDRGRVLGLTKWGYASNDYNTKHARFVSDPWCLAPIIQY